MTVFAPTCAIVALVALVALAAPGPALASDRPSEPLSEWLAGIGAAAQAQADGQLHVAEGAARRALAARPRGPAGARAQAALGLALLARDAPAAAAEALETALASPIAARAHLAFARGEALARAGDAPAAARLFDEAAAGARGLALEQAARIREGEALLDAGLAGEALVTLDAVLAAGPDEAAAARVRLALGRALRAVGDEARAAETWRSLWLELPERPEATAAGERLDAWRAAGGQLPPPSGADRTLRAERLLAANRPEQALLELEEARRADEPAGDPERWAALRAWALVLLGRHEDAERVALPIAGAASPEAQRLARLVLARAASRAGRLEEASRFYADVAESRAAVPGLPDWRQRDIGDEAAFLSAWLPYDAGDFARAIPALQAFARANPRSRRAEDALWFAAWSRHRLGRPQEASRALARLSRGPLAEAALYWRARLARGAARQRRLYRACLAAGGTGWYALLARARLAALGDPAPPPRAPDARALPDLEDGLAAGRLAIAVELLAFGLRDGALAELADLSRAGRVRPAAPLVAQLAAFADDAELPFRMARDHLLPTRRALRWAYPEPERDAVVSAAEALAVDPALVFGVMRRESAFRADALSPAGAVGLLQLRPVTAERLAAILGIRGDVGDRLRDPRTNVGLGTHYLALLLDRFGEPATAVAAYNAGPEVAAGWARERARMPLDAWVESIPYRETRQYVKIVLAEWAAYRALAGDPAPPIDPARPIAAPGPGVGF